MNEHGTRDTEPMFKHLSECKMFKETCNLYALQHYIMKVTRTKLH